MQDERIIDLEIMEDGTYGPNGTQGQHHGTSYGPGLGDAIDLIGELLASLAPGRRAQAVAEALILAGLVRNAQALRNAAENNVPVEQFLEYIDVRALVRLVAESSETTVVTIQREAGKLGAAYVAGIGTKWLFDYLTSD